MKKIAFGIIAGVICISLAVLAHHSTEATIIPPSSPQATIIPPSSPTGTTVATIIPPSSPDTPQG